MLYYNALKNYFNHHYPKNNPFISVESNHSFSPLKTVNGKHIQFLGYGVWFLIFLKTDIIKHYSC